MDKHVKEEEQLTTNTNPKPPLVSITSWLDDDESQGGRPLSALRLSTEPVYVSLFTDQGCRCRGALSGSDRWLVRRLCPLPRQGLSGMRGADRPQTVSAAAGRRSDRRQVKLLRVPAEKGPGRLRTEIVKVLGLPDRAGIVTRITPRAGLPVHRRCASQDALAPDVAAAIKRFVDALDAKLIDLRSDRHQHDRGRNGGARARRQAPRRWRVGQWRDPADRRTPACGFSRPRAGARRALQQIPADDEVCSCRCRLVSARAGRHRRSCAHALAHGHDLVVYVAPTRGIIDEMHIAGRTAAGDGRHLRPRPGGFAARRCRVEQPRTQRLRRAREEHCSAGLRRARGKWRRLFGWPDQLDTNRPGHPSGGADRAVSAAQPAVASAISAQARRCQARRWSSSTRRCS